MVAREKEKRGGGEKGKEAGEEGKSTKNKGRRG